MARPRKTDVEKKVAAVKPAEAEEKKAVKRGRPKKTDTVAAKTVNKPSPPIKKAPAAKADVSEKSAAAASEFIIQYEGCNYDIEQIKSKVNEAIKNSKKRGVKRVGIYVQPKERLVYYSVNGKDGGKLEL